MALLYVYNKNSDILMWHNQVAVVPLDIICSQTLRDKII